MGRARVPAHRSRLFLAVVAAVVALVASGCTAVDPPEATSSEQPLSQSGCPGSGPATSAEVIIFEGTSYERVYAAPPIAESQLGVQVGVVGCGQRVADPGTDGATPSRVWELDGFEQSFRLVVDHSEGLILFEVTLIQGPSPRAVLGDLENLVTGIVVRSDDGEAAIGYISDAAVVRDLIAQILDGETFSRGGGVGETMVLELEFEGAPPSRQVLWPDSRRLASGVEVPQSFVDAVLEAVER